MYPCVCGVMQSYFMNIIHTGYEALWFQLYVNVGEFAPCTGWDVSNISEMKFLNIIYSSGND